jgi:hypothetical protein
MSEFIPLWWRVEKQISCSNAINSSLSNLVKRKEISKPGARAVMVGLVQMQCTARPERNLKKALALIDRAAKAGGTDPGSDHRGAGPRGAPAPDHINRIDLRTSDGRYLSQHRGRVR